MSYLSIDEVMRRGIEFTGDVCYSGEYGQQVYTKEAEDGGIPVEGILYEKYDNGKICYYCFYHDGIPDGQRVRFYETGKKRVVVLWIKEQLMANILSGMKMVILN